MSDRFCIVVLSCSVRGRNLAQSFVVWRVGVGPNFVSGVCMCCGGGLVAEVDFFHVAASC